MKIRSEIKIEKREFPKVEDLDYGTVFVFADEPDRLYFWIDSNQYVDLEEGRLYDLCDEEPWKEVREIKCTLVIEGIK